MKEWVVEMLYQLRYQIGASHIPQQTTLVFCSDLSVHHIAKILLKSMCGLAMDEM